MDKPEQIRVFKIGRLCDGKQLGRRGLLETDLAGLRPNGYEDVDAKGCSSGVMFAIKDAEQAIRVREQGLSREDVSLRDTRCMRTCIIVGPAAERPLSLTRELIETVANESVEVIGIVDSMG